MARLTQLALETTTGKTRELLEGVKGKLGRVPNLMAALANSPAALEGYLGLSGTLGRGGLSAKDRERISLAVAEANGCEYCLAAHSTLGKLAGLTSEQVRESRLGTATDPKADALLRFVRRVVDTRGKVTDSDVAVVREQGYSDADLAEIVVNVALNVLTNYFNNVVQSDVDFPAAEPISDHGPACTR